MDMSTIVKIVALDLVAMLAFPASCGQAPCDRPLMSMRLRADDTGTKETWKANFKAIMENPGCCDEMWFSTGAFNAETGGKWTRETLGKAVAEDDGVCARWPGTKCAALRQGSNSSEPTTGHT